MKNHDEILRKMIVAALSGKGAHVEVRNAVAGLDWKIAGIRPAGAAHSIFQLLNHIVYWHEWMVRWLDGENPPAPKHASGSWPGSEKPASPEEWKEALLRLDKVLAALTRRTRAHGLLEKRGRKTRLEMLQTIASHGSYHIGQLVALRQMLGAWPPPSGSVTW